MRCHVWLLDPARGTSRADVRAAREAARAQRRRRSLLARCRSALGRGRRVDSFRPAVSDLPALRRAARRMEPGALAAAYAKAGGRCTAFELDGFVHGVFEFPADEVTRVAAAVGTLIRRQ
jgi:hypothetical protein